MAGKFNKDLTLAILIVVQITVIHGILNLSDIPCGRGQNGAKSQMRIIGGVDANPGEFPWIVSLTKQGSHFCGGIIISNQWILTAAHCMCTGKNSYYSAQRVKITVARHDLRAAVNGHEQGVDNELVEMNLREIHVHPRYDCRYRWKNDIALLRLRDSIRWTDRVQPTCLTDELTAGLDELANAQVATVAGWGTTDEKVYSPADILQKADVNLIDNTICNEWLDDILTLSKDQMCAGYARGGIDACFADSGGPLMVSESADVITTVGIVSTGVGCAREKLPGIYTRISEYLPWINSTMSHFV